MRVVSRPTTTSPLQSTDTRNGCRHHNGRRRSISSSSSGGDGDGDGDGRLASHADGNANNTANDHAPSGDSNVGSSLSLHTHEQQQQPLRSVEEIFLHPRAKSVPPRHAVNTSTSLLPITSKCMDQLPVVINSFIFTYLTLTDFINLSHVNKHWLNISKMSTSRHPHWGHIRLKLH
jgi:hypothetical protein